ncbi:MAG: 3-oxoacyl-ACP synthase III, partial [Planctomycetales bacterium]|nr:3-oxoacyl-ACP synthase III [Planctomycetales bacterium]
MNYRNVCLESLGYTLPDEVVSSEEIEARLAPLYRRLRLPEGRLVLMTGIRERRFWAPGTMPSQISVASARRAIEECGIGLDRIGAIVHASVCRDYLEPATSCVVHDRLGLPSDCVVYDCSNACLGFLNGMIQIANMIELGQIEAGLVVASEGSRELVETTIARLNADESFTRETVKPAMASLTIGSASAAAVLVDRRISQTDNRLLGAVARADTSAVGLCQSGRDESVGGKMQPLMNTDAEQLMAAGVALAAVTFGRFVDELAWSVDDINRTCCHQV